LSSEAPLSTATRCGHIALIGRPNAGKSTLLNAILGEHLSIVTPKPQTTRKRVLGIHTSNDTQLIFIDTPGILKPRYRMQNAMMGYVQETLAESNAVCLIVDITKVVERGTIIDPLMKQVLESDDAPPVILVINKMDALKDPKLALPFIEEARLSGLFARSVAISAKQNREVDELVSILRELAPEGEFLYDAEQVSTLPQRFFVAELIREAIFMYYREEIPYATDVTVIEFKENDSGKWHITADITVERETQKGILIGKKGEALKQIGIEARAKIEDHLQQPIFLELFVKVRKDWRNDPNQLQNLGY
jgi:GTPase